MSGGHFDKNEYHLQAVCDQVAEDEAVRRRFPDLAGLLPDLGLILTEAIHAIDYDLSGDTFIEDDAAFEQSVMDRIAAIVDKAKRS